MKELYLFGLRIKELRINSKLSQEKLATQADISSKYMSRIETGKHFPSFDVLTKLANALNVEVKDFFEFTHVTENAHNLRKASVEMLNNASEEQLRVIYKFLRDY
jgi:transcriptional regulator with XRE-family HTH domain